MPALMPSTCGTVRFRPKLTPEASSIVLLGPGVIVVTSANSAAAGRAFRSSVGMARSGNCRFDGAKCTGG